MKSSNAPLIALVLGSLAVAAAVVFGLERMVNGDVHDALRAMPIGSARGLP